MNYETHIPTQQAPTQEDSRLPRANENNLRQKDHQPPPKNGPQKAGSLKFPKTLRLQRRGQFARVAREGKRLVGRYFCIDYRPAKTPKLGISAPVRYGSSPKRNRFKRLIREAFRKSYTTLPPYEMNIIPRQSAKGATGDQIFEEFNRLLR